MKGLHRSYTNEQHFNERCTLSKAKHFINAYKIFLGSMKGKRVQEKQSSRERERERWRSVRCKNLCGKWIYAWDLVVLKTIPLSSLHTKQQTLHLPCLLAADSLALRQLFWRSFVHIG